jgi:large subunit ribosomal protein L16
MILQPNRTKFAKYHKLRIKGKEHKPSSSYLLTFGMSGLQCLESGIILPRQLEAARRATVRNLQGPGRVWIRVFPQSVVTSKPKEVRMGRGKGDFKTYVFKAKSGRLLLEVIAKNTEVAVQALRIAATKLPVKCQVVMKGL